jgi:hypothetical protein
MIRLSRRTVFPFTSKAHVASWCWLDVFKIHDYPVVVFTQDRPHHGPTITNNVEQIIRRYQHMAESMNLPMEDKMFFLEHYNDERFEFCHIVLSENGQEPKWFKIDEEFAWLLAGALGELEDTFECQVS